jgi:hypothetical protein
VNTLVDCFRGKDTTIFRETKDFEGKNVEWDVFAALGGWGRGNKLP